MRRGVRKSMLAISAVSILAACGSGEDGAELEEGVVEDNAASAASTANMGAGDDASAPAPAGQDDTAKENQAASEAFLTSNSAKEGVTVTASGLQYMILEEGPDTGSTPKSSETVDVHYVGTLIDGVEFDSSRARGAAARFRADQVIDGWVEGLQLMSEGDRFRFFIPADLAYGKSGTPGGPIGPNQALIFDVELLKVISPEKNLAEAEAFLTSNADKEGIKKTDSGLQYKVIASGAADGKTPTEANVVKVHYEGRLLNGSVFDSSIERGEPIEFPLGGVIPGWIEALQLMREGDKFQLFIPPELAYGARGTPGGPIGPNELLVFDVELIEVK